ncbi:TetR family transcriptional regulator [Brenneria roseae subsp. americana]|uniref:TetR family transcriptional regulator n=1 Tax=Brenneria roseae subsp. americana TaxID=1508507 RepID=A0A2U1U1Q6_9GAMM|nr:TetR/AcrR family transcriptional regulator [Brenneria roseae]PWC15574.1 TetR family transcriptional regulator [Brenneria roseae subsp. americana]
MNSPSTISPSAPETGQDNLNEKARLVLKAATSVFLAHGFSAATTDMIQREAGVSKSTVYAHYANKEALFVAVIKTECATFARTVQNIRFQSGGLRKTLTALGRAYLEILLSPTGLALYRVAIAEAPKFPQLAQTFYLAGPRVIAAILTEQLAHAEQAGEIDTTTVGVETMASLFSNLVRGEAQLQYLTHPDPSPSAAQIDHWVEVAVTTFLCAFGRTPDPSFKG